MYDLSLPLIQISIHIGSIRKDAKRVFNAKKQYTVTQHRLSEIDTNLYIVLGHDFYTNTFKVSQI